MDEASKEQAGGWLSRLQAGDQRAFAEFVDRYKQTIFLCCRTLGLQEEESEDVASETFLAAYKGIGRYKGRAKLSTWLWRIAYCQGINYLRKNRKIAQILAEPNQQLELIHIREQGPPSVLQEGEREKIIWEAVKRLPRLWAMAVILFYREGKSVKEIAKIMQISQNTVKTYLFRSRNRLREILTAAFGEDVDVGG